jgi:hypothetical protein
MAIKDANESVKQLYSKQYITFLDPNKTDVLSR